MEYEVGSMLLITANIGSLFEHPRMIQGWCAEMLNVMQKHNPNIVVFGFQALGGKDSASLHNMELFCEWFSKLIVKNREDEDRFYSTGIIFDDNLSSSDFTAMGNIVLIRNSIANNISIWDFQEKEFKSIYCCNKNQELISKNNKFYFCGS